MKRPTPPEPKAAARSTKQKGSSPSGGQKTSVEVPSLPDRGSPLLEHIGAQIRERRQALALTLRELAERSGVSERFLVLLEGGRANVSVVRLADVASALGTTPVEILGGTATGGLGAQQAASGPLIALLGLRGAGKTSIGERSAARLGLNFIELDTLITERAGMSLGEIFELHGGAYYRRIEREEIERLIDSGARGILATGGSLVTDHDTFARLRGAAVTVWLRASAEDHWSRVIAQGDARPMANRAHAMKELRALLGARRALYERCDHIVDTSALGLARSIDRVVRLAREACSRTSLPSA